MKTIKILIYVIILVKICIASECENHESGCEQYSSEGEGDTLKKCFYIDSQEKCGLKSCSDFEEDSCSEFGSDNGLQCLKKMSWAPDRQNIITNGCALQQCNDLPDGYCSLFQANGDKYCIENEDSTGCVLMSCSDLTPGQCGRFIFPGNEFQCVETEDGQGCEPKKCSDYSSNQCNKFNPNNEHYKCLPEGTGCIQKQCSSLIPPNCGDINPMKNNLLTCEAIEGVCTETYKKCEELPYQYCSLYQRSFYYLQEGGKCIKNEISKKCELKKCETTPSGQCSSFISDNPDEICTDSGDNKCEIKKCSTLPKTECSQFLPNDKGYKCVENGDNCQIVEKDCETDLLENECQFYHPSDETQTCSPNGSGGCTLLSCGDFSLDECSQFKSENPDRQCIPTTDGCQLLRCEDLPNNECNKFLTGDLPYTCENQGNDYCWPEEKNCHDLPIKYCSETFVNKQCVLNEKGNKCEYFNDGYNSEDNSNGSKGRKKNNSSRILFSISPIYILLLLI